MRSLEQLARANGDRERMQELLPPGAPAWVVSAAMQTDNETQRKLARLWVSQRLGTLDRPIVEYDLTRWPPERCYETYYPGLSELAVDIVHLDSPIVLRLTLATEEVEMASAFYNLFGR